MLKVVLLVTLVGYCESFNVPLFDQNVEQTAAAQNLASLMALSSLGGSGLGGSGLGGSGLGSSGGGSSSTSSGGSGGEGITGLLNNPMVLCRRTENFRPIPCRRMTGICNLMSVTQYGFPGLLECSPMGIGCCIKDFTSLMMVNMLNYPWLNGLLPPYVFCQKGFVTLMVKIKVNSPDWIHTMVVRELCVDCQ